MFHDSSLGKIAMQHTIRLTGGLGQCKKLQDVFAAACCCAVDVVGAKIDKVKTVLTF